MNILKILFLVLVILFGVFMLVFGELDDSPGGQLIGVLVAIAGIVGLVKNRKLNLLPKTILGKVSVGLIILFFLILALFFLFIALGQRGGQGFFDNLYLVIPGVLMAISGIAAFFTGIIGIIKKDYSVLLFFSTIIGFLVLFQVFIEIIFSH